MASWILVPCLVALRREFDETAPGRAHESDGSIGDPAHQASTSDHNPDEHGSVPIHDADRVNEVHAIDLTADLRTPGLTMETVVQHIVARCRSGAERRLRYVIYNRRIWDYRNGWLSKPYSGPSPHIEHAHFSASYETKWEASTASWHLEEIPVALTAGDKAWLAETIASTVAVKLNAALAANNDDIWNVKGDVNIGKVGKPSMQTMLNITRYGSYERHQIIAMLADVADAVKALTPAPTAPPAA